MAPEILCYNLYHYGLNLKRISNRWLWVLLHVSLQLRYAWTGGREARRRRSRRRDRRVHHTSSVRAWRMRQALSCYDLCRGTRRQRHNICILPLGAR